MRTSDLIDRQALKDKLKRWDECDPYEFVEIAFHAVEDAPTIDAVPVVHGKWIHLYKNNYRCSVCGAWFIFEDENNPYEEGRFCPYCGARMGERRES